ncbi:MAG: cytochrome c [Sediminibacterium sp.]|nr:cytochrome c [Sediminibacterium sp.]MBP6144600.1 cytochrome c [Sediminibacterium sp.]
MQKAPFKLLSLFLTAFLFCSIQSNAQNMQKGKKIYETRCLACHQADGGGVPNMNAPLDGASNVVGNDIARLVRVIRNGYNERVALDGFYYSNAMTASPDLKDNELADLLTYIRNSWSNKASAINVAQVQAAKKKK